MWAATTQLALAVTPSVDVTAAMKLAVPDDFASAKAHGAKIKKVDHDQNYIVRWKPQGFDRKTGITLVSLHGHEGWAVTEFEKWYPELTERGYAYVGIQYWFGTGSTTDDYYKNKKITKIIRHRLKHYNVKHGSVIFHGFSMGSARSYGVALLDGQKQKPYFGVTISNAGAWADNYPMYANVLNGKYGNHPFKHDQFIFYCAGQDASHPTSCTDFGHTADVIASLGGEVNLFIRDANGQHGSFMLNEANRDEALDEAESLLIFR